MNQRMLATYRDLLALHRAARDASSLVDALESCTRILATALDATFATLWLKVAQHDIVRPVFWVGHRDMSSCVHEKGAGVVGRTFQEQTPLRAFEFHGNDDWNTTSDYPDVRITSMLCIPLDLGPAGIGVAQLVNKNDGGSYTADEADFVEWALHACVEEAPRASGELHLLPYPGRELMGLSGVMCRLPDAGTYRLPLKGMNLSIFDGELLVVWGESGSGKSTLLNVAAGLCQPTQGSVLFEGHRLAQEHDSDTLAFRNAYAGVLLGNHPVQLDLTTWQAVDLAASLAPDPLDTDEALALAGIRGADSTPLHACSALQRQRVALAQSLVKQPRILLANEPTQSLPSHEATQLLATLQNVAHAGTSVVVATHNKAIGAIGDRGVLLRDGRLCQGTVNLPPADATQIDW